MQARGGHTNYLNIILRHTSWHREADQGKRKDGGGGDDTQSWQDSPTPT